MKFDLSGAIGASVLSLSQDSLFSMTLIGQRQEHLISSEQEHLSLRTSDKELHPASLRDWGQPSIRV